MNNSGPGMVAAVYRNGEITVKKITRPRLGRGEALLRVEAAALCATDLKIWRRGHRNISRDSETVLGHEVVGRVVEVGAGVDPALEGKRVVVAPNVGCGFCPACLAGWDSYCPSYKAYGVGLPGALAEYMAVAAPTINRGSLIEVPGAIPARVAVLAEAVSCCYRGLKECGLTAGETVLVMGAGPMGILTVITAAVMGAAVIIAADPLEERRKRSLAFPADHALDPAAGGFFGVLGEITGGRGVDVVMVTAPSVQAQRQALEAAAVRGRINFFAGLSPGDTFNDFPANLVHYRGLKILGTTGTTPAEMRAVIALMAGRRLELLQGVVTAVYPLSRADEAFQEAARGEGLKVMVVPG